MKYRELLTLLLTVVVFLILILFINPQVFFQEVSTISLPILVLVVVLFVIDLFLRVVRWWVLLLTQEHRIPFRSLVSPIMVSAFLNVLIPARAGEVVRLYALREKHDVRYSVGLSVIVVEQVINLLSLVLVAAGALGLVLLLGVSLSYEVLDILTPIAFIGMVGLVGCLVVLLVVDPLFFSPLLRLLPQKITSKAESMLKTFAFGLKILRGNWLILGAGVASSAVIWIIEGFIIWLLAIEFINPDYELSIAFLASTFGNMTFMFPILPGAAGQYEAVVAIILTLSPLYASKNGVLVAVLDRLVKTGVMAILGGYATVKFGVRRVLVVRDEEGAEIREEQAEISNLVDKSDVMDVS